MRKELRDAEPESYILKKLNNDNERALAQYLNEFIINESIYHRRSEAFTDNFICYLLTELKFNRYPLVLKLQPDVKMRTLTLFDTTESQLSAEILACAYTNFENGDNPMFRIDQMVYEAFLL
ncbi:5544_t:CDS:2 [Diversispora eburnea]|uniref:5544_t:CDS:1 n=1 Tax=Diversispora eburnea TaxID=1213867 RepID=A0A9N8V3H2_9GLOM|nr:5544_t:CDS:2 [Diversispora eburnea]